MGNILNDDFREFIQTLNGNNVEYLLVGGYSVIAYGYSRTTGDMDIWVKRTKKNYQKLVKAFKQFRMPVFQMTQDNFLHHPRWDVFRFGRKPVAIDIMIKIKGLNFNDSLTNANSFTIDGIEIKMIKYSDLIKSKKASGRPKDIDDIEGLEMQK